MRLLAPRERTQIEHEVRHPDDHQPDIGVPLRFGVFLRLSHTHQVAGRGNNAEQIVAEQHEPWAELVRQPRARRALHHVERGRDQRIAAEAEDDAGRMHRPQPAKTRPRRIERQVGIGQQPRHPVADEHGDDTPDHGGDNAELGRRVVIAVEPAVGGLRIIIAGDHCENAGDGENHHQRAVNAERIALTADGHGQAGDRKRQKNNESALAFVCREFGDHRSSPLFHHAAGAVSAVKGCLAG